MTDFRDGLGYVHNRLVRHSAESLAAVPPLTAPGARRVVLAGDRIVLADGSALLAPDRIGAEPGPTLFLGRLDGAGHPLRSVEDLRSFYRRAADAGQVVIVAEV